MAASYETADVSSALSNFERSANDAERMLRLAAGLADLRVNRMRADFKETLGAALKVPSEKRSLLERAESGEAWVILKPHAKLRRDMFGEDALTPLVRQSVVVIGAAVESFVADCAIATLREMLARSDMPAFAVDLMVKQIRIDASAHPKKIKEVFRRVGVEDALAAASSEAGFTINEPLSRLVGARNEIAHGGVPEALTCDGAMKLLDEARQVVRALDAALARLR